MPSVHDIAMYVLVRFGPLSAMKLQKLVYYSQAWALASDRGPLFPEKILAWAHGPVVYELFEQHRRRFVVSSLPLGAPARARSHELLLDGVLNHYGSMPAEKLSALTHSEEPWRLARVAVAEKALGYREITQDSIRRYYAARPRPF